MKILYLFIVTIFMALGSAAQVDVVVDPNVSLRTLIGEFNTLKVSNGIDVYLSQSDNTAIAVSAADEKHKAGIKTVIENGTLHISYDGEKGWNKKDRNLKVYVSFEDLKKIYATGASDVFVIGSITVTALDIQMTGACDFKGLVKVNSLKLKLSGASDVKISGTANNVDIECSGASDVKGFDFITDYCTANISGASDVNITVNKELKAHASGASDIKYKGNAVVVEKQSGGATSITKVN